MSKSSDFQKPFFDLIARLSDVYQSKTNIALFNNTFNRFLSKTELESIVGIIGERNLNASTDRQIDEFTPHRQAFQLQPLLYNKIATVNYVASHADLLLAAQRLGIDVSNFSEWGSTKQFNFIPPIDIDKLVNYADYYWYDTSTSSPKPQYITIKDNCVIAQSRLNEKLIQLSGLLQHAIRGIQQSTNSFRIDGDFTTIFDVGLQFNVINSLNNTGLWTVVSSSYIGQFTFITTAENIDLSAVDGDITLQNQIQAFQDAVTTACSVVTTNGWINENKWVHISDVPNISLGIRAQFPIIEYFPKLEQNEWSFTKHQWKYRQSSLFDWVDATTQPTVLELGVQVLKTLPGSPHTHTSLICARGDIRHLLVIGGNITLYDSTDDGQYVVDSFTYDGILNQTNVGVVGVLTSMLTPNGFIGPTVTSLNHVWVSNTEHWAYVSETSPAPAGNPTLYADAIADTLTTQSIPLQQYELDYNSILLIHNDVIKVYVNNVRQYGSYEELTELDATGSGDNNYLYAIKFFNVLLASDVLRVEISAGAQDDINREVVSVRTELNDDAFALLPIGQHTTRRSIVQYRKHEQVKSQHTQYPLYNMYNVDGSFYGVSSLFSYSTGPQYQAQDAFGGLRIAVVDASTNNYQFTQHLIKDGDKLLAYIDNDTVSALNTIWKEGVGADEFYVPTYVDAQRRVNGESFVNSNGDVEIAVVNSSNGDWEIPNTLFFNASHQNKSTIKFNELLTHFSTIIENQYVPTGFKNTPRLWRLLEQPTYGLGGTIKEHNGSYDTFLSSLFVTTGTTLDVLDFSSVRYTNFIDNIIDRFFQTVTTSLLNVDSTAINSLTTTITNLLIEEHEQNDANVNVFGDSNTFDPATSIGIRHWIASRVFLGLADKVQPEVLRDDGFGIFEIIHHDGHVSELELTVSNVNNILFDIRTTRHTSVPVVSFDLWVADPVTFVNELKYAYWMNTEVIRPDSWNVADSLINIATRTGQYWYGQYGISVVDVLYRFNIEYTGVTEPPSFELDGTLWFNTLTNLLMIRDSVGVNDWNPVSGVMFDVMAAWSIVDLRSSLASVILEIEQRLFNVSTQANVFDVADYTVTPANQVSFDNNMIRFFNNYARSRNILDPFSNVDNYDLNDAFTWNYGGVVNTNITTHITSNVFYPSGTMLWGNTWWDIYEKLFNTSYPHLQPWKLQGYTSKPTWWDLEYATDPTRRWAAGMWTNILAGIVPVGYALSTGVTSVGLGGQATIYTHVCVNIGLITIDGYEPDALLPPFYDITLDPTLAGFTLIRDQAFIPDNATTFPGVTLTTSNFIFGDNGPIEWEWRKSNTYQHDVLKSSYLLYPMRFMNAFFGTQFTTIGGLEIDVLTERTYTHKNAILHGDLLTSNSIYISQGINQWYINYNRFNGFDNKLSDFRALWTGWNPTFAYQFDTFVDTDSFKMASRNFELDVTDYEIIIKKSAGLYTSEFSSLNITTTKFTPILGVDPNDKGDAWTFLIDSPALLSDAISYYGVSANPVSDFDTLISNKYRTWVHYEIDKSVVLTGTFPIEITGIQNVINFVDGYVSHAEGLGFQFFDVDETEVDIETGKIVSWQVEVERWIAFNYRMRATIFDDGVATARNPMFELNASRNSITFNHPKGVLADIVEGPFVNKKAAQTIYDQYGRPLTTNQLMVFRSDTSTQIVIRNNLPNELTRSTSQYDFIHFGGITLHVDAYEHVVLLSNYSLDGNLIYDPFLGLNIKRFLLSFDKQLTQTQRPHIGGYYLTDNKFKHNMEGSIELMQTYYDTYQASETNKVIEESRKLVNYQYPQYLDNININSKSAFLFQKGLVQVKGSSKIINAIVNSKHFIDASIDEFWAFKIAEFGDNKTKICPEIRINAADVEQDKLNIHFTDLAYDPTASTGFIEVTKNDDVRWYNYPNILEHFEETSANFFFDAELNLLDISKYVIELIDGTDGIYRMVDTVDDILITFHTGANETQFTLLGTGSPETITVPQYIPQTTSLNVYFDGVLITDYVEVGASTTLSTSITLSRTVGGQVTVVTSTGVLVNGLHYEKLNSFLYRIYNQGFLTDIKIFTINPDKDKSSPCKLRDIDAEVIVDTIPIWDPVRDHHEYLVDNIIDLKDVQDPALYTASTLPTNINVNTAWMLPEVGKVWLDLGDVDYLPYYDDVRLPNIDDRLLFWGRLAPWSKLGLYEWTESDVHPSMWAQKVISEDVDDNILSSKKASGSAKTTLYKRDREHDEVTIQLYNVASTSVTFDVGIFATLKNTDQTELTFSSYSGRVELVIDEAFPGTPILVPFIVDGSLSQTYGELASQIQEDLSNYPIVVSIQNNAITFVSTDKSIRGITVVDVDLFVALERFGTPAVTLVNANPITAQNSLLVPLLGVPTWFQHNLPIFLFTDGTLPTGLAIETQYLLHFEVTLNHWLLKDAVTNVIFALTDVGVGVHTIGNVAFLDDWAVEKDQHGEFFEALKVNHDYIVSNPNIFFRDSVNVYINGVFKLVSTIIDVAKHVDVSGLTLTDSDVVHVVKTRYVPTEADIEFNPVMLDEGKFLTQYKFDYEYTLRNVYAENGVDLIPVYYFWVSDKVTRIKGSVSLIEGVSELTLPTRPYMIIQNLFKRTPFLDPATSVGYTQLVVRGLSTRVSASDRFNLRILKDLTLRDDINDGTTSLSLKNRHVEWLLFREKQIQHVPRQLWDRMIEAVMGFELTGFDTGVRTPVPAVERVLYDALYSTDFRYGLEKGQAFIDSKLAIATLIEIFENPSIFLDPIDKELFLANYPFDTPENIKIALEYIYNIFPSQHVNFILFELIHDAMSLTFKYPGIFKTSAIALTGVRLLESAGNVIDEF